MANLRLLTGIGVVTVLLFTCFMLMIWTVASFATYAENTSRCEGVVWQGVCQNRADNTLVQSVFFGILIAGVIVAPTLLVGGLVWFYCHSELQRKRKQQIIWQQAVKPQ